MKRCPIILAVLMAFSLLLQPAAFAATAASTTKTTSAANKAMPKEVLLPVNKTNFFVDNKWVELGKKTPEELPSFLKDGTLMIPLKPLADIFNGTLTISAKKDKATLKIDKTVFEFTLYKTQAKIDGKSYTMPHEASYRQGIVKVPACIFVDHMKDYDVVNERRTLMFRQKGNKIWYDADGKVISLFSDWYSTYSDKWYKDFSKDQRVLYKQVRDIANNITAEIIKPGMSDFERLMAVNKYIVENKTFKKSHSTSLFDAMLNKTANSFQYSVAACILLNQAGVETRMVRGFRKSLGDESTLDLYEMTNYESHYWNIVKIDNKYFHLDVALNDQELNFIETTELMYDYLLRSDEQMEVNHIWETELFPKCPDAYDEGLISRVKALGYDPITGTLTLEQGVAKEDIYYVFTVNKGDYSYSEFISTQYIKIPKGKSSASFMFIPDKKYAAEELGVGMEIYDNNGRYDMIGDYWLEEKSWDSHNLQLSVKAVETTPLQLIAVFTEPVQVEQNMAITVKTFVPGDGRKICYSADSIFTVLKPGMTEVPLNCHIALPAEEFMYAIRLYENEHDGYVNTNGEFIAFEDFYIRAITEAQMIPSSAVGNGFKLKIPEDYLLKPNKAVIPVVALTKEQLAGIKDILVGAHIGESAALGKLKSNEDARKFEKTAPTEVDSRGTIYYQCTLPSGVQLYRSYNEIDNPKQLDYSVSINYLDINEGNYQELMNTINLYMKDLLKAGTLSEVKAYKDGTGWIKWKDMKSSELIGQIKKGYISMSIMYKVNNITWVVSLGGNPYDESLHLGIRGAIKK